MSFLFYCNFRQSYKSKINCMRLSIRQWIFKMAITISKTEPHLTPAKLVGERFKKNTFGKMKIALIGYCPPPSILQKYNPISTQDQYFIHVSPDSVKMCSYKNIEFLSLFHVYGGPVSASTIEELAYFDFDYILAYGLAGGLGTKELKMGDYYLVESACVFDGTTPHYTKDFIVKSNDSLQSNILLLSKNTALENIKPVRAVTGDAIYRENDAFLISSREAGCDIINLDSSHLFAVSIHNHENKKIKTIECGIISDVTSEVGHDWDSTLSVMLSSTSTNQLNPLELTGKIVEFYVERLAPVLLNK